MDLRLFIYCTISFTGKCLRFSPIVIYTNPIWNGRFPIDIFVFRDGYSWDPMNTISVNISFSLSRNSKAISNDNKFPWHEIIPQNRYRGSHRGVVSVHQVWNIHNNLSAVYHQCPRVIIYKSKTSNTRRCVRWRDEMVCVLRLARFCNGSMHGNCHPKYLFL